MNRICVRFTASVFIGGLLAGTTIGMAWGQTPTPAPTPAASKPASLAVETPEPADKVVLKVGAKQFTKADMDSLIGSLTPQAQQAIATQPQAKQKLGDQYALIVMLSQQAESRHLDQTPEFAHKLAFQKQQLEAQTVLEQINQQAKITPEEIQQYYTTHAADYDEITVRQIVVRKKVEPQAGTGNAQPSTGLAPEEAKARAAAIRKELMAGTDIKKVMEDFKAPTDVIIEAEPRKTRRGAMRPEMEKVAFALKDGEVSDPIDVPQALIFFQVTGHSHAELKAVTPDIEKSLRQQKIDSALAEVKKNSNLWMDEKYFGTSPKAQEGPTLGAPLPQTPPKP
jgi:parvulin-like peptidyl-prolyl isomerase